MRNEQSNLQCPKCGKKSLLVQPLQDGRKELICLDLDCDFAEVVSDADSLAPPGDARNSFAQRVTTIADEHLRDMADNLANSTEQLSGKSKRTAKQQLALVTAELDKRQRQTAELAAGPQGAVPPQFNTPQAKAKRLRGIRQYHLRKKQQAVDLAPQQQQRLNPSWLETVTSTLQQEVEHHEEAARNYARTPELFPLHIDHSARAFELKHVLNLLRPFIHNQT